MVRICFIGIMIGTFALALVSAVMHGFEVAIHKKMQGIQPQIIIRGFGQPLSDKAIARVLKKEFPEVAAFSPTASHHAIVQTNDSDPFIIALRGINPLYESQVSALEKKVVGPHNIPVSLGDAISQDQLLIGKKLAEQLGVHLHDPIQLFFYVQYPSLVIYFLSYTYLILQNVILGKCLFFLFVVLVTRLQINLKGVQPKTHI